MNPKGKIYDTDNLETPWWKHKPAVMSVGAMALTLLLIIGFRSQTIIFILAALWAVGVPLWFFIDFYYVYRKHAADESWELFKHGQQVSFAIWAGVTATLFALAASDIAKPEKKEIECTLVASEAGISASSASVPIAIKCPQKQ